MYRIEIEHEGHWLTGGSSGIDDLGGEFRTIEDARTTIKACANTERMEGREPPHVRIVSMATAAARALRAIPSERVAKFICRSCGDMIPESEVELDAVEDKYVHAAEGDYKDGMWHRVMCGPIVRIEEVPCE